MKNKPIPIAKLFPNIVTFLGICIGLTSIRFSFAGKWEFAIIAILVSAIVDGIDGRLARMLDSTSQFGAELDSLADLISFGVAPAFLLYFWELKDIKVVGWALTMAFVICMAIRLARFNSALIQDNGEKQNRHFFTGVPAPAGAILVLLPVIITLNGYDNLSNAMHNHYFIPFYVITIAMLIVSRIPTFSLKHIKIPSYLDSFLMFLFAIVVIFFITKPWVTIPILAAAYIISMPFSIFYFSKSIVE